MEGVTTAIVAFIFVCIVYPRLVRVRAQFYAAVAAVLLILLFHSLAIMIRSGGFSVFVGALTGLLQLAAFILLILATGGLSLRELTGDVMGAFEVVRRGEQDKEIIIPRSAQPPIPAPTAPERATGPGATAGDEPRRNVYTINSPEPSTAAATPPEAPQAPFPPPTPHDQVAAPTPPLGKPDDKPADRAIPLD